MSTITAQQQHISNAFFRLLVMAKIFEQDSAYFLPLCKNSGVKSTLKRIKDSVGSNSMQLYAAYSPEAQQAIKNTVTTEKVASIQNILSRLILMNDAQLSELEDQILQITKVEA